MFFPGDPMCGHITPPGCTKDFPLFKEVREIWGDMT